MALHAFIRTKISGIFILGLLLGTLVLLYRLMSPFAGVLVGALTLGILFHPFHRRLVRRFPRLSPSWQAAGSCLLILFFFVIPMTLTFWTAVQDSENWLPVLHQWHGRLDQWRDGTIDSNEPLRRLKAWLSETFAIRPSDFRRQVVLLSDNILKAAAETAARITRGLVGFLFSTGLTALTLFFVLRDGESFYGRFESYLPFSETKKIEFKNRALRVVTGVIRGWFLCAVLQGFVAGIGYFLAGIHAWILFGLLTMFSGLIPFLGTALVWVPLGINALLQDSYGRGIFILAWGGGIVGIMDNFLRPYLIGHKLDIPFLYLLFALLGGLQVWGVKGIILGPVLVALAPVVFDMYRERYVEGKPARRTPEKILLGRSSSERAEEPALLEPRAGSR